MRVHLVYDLPTRMFHWIFAILFVSAFIIAKTVDDESFTFSYHMLIGLTLSFAVIMRILWGLVGTKHARFSGFALNPSDLRSYFQKIMRGEKKLWAGHNPASSWAAIVMMILALGLGTTGYLMSTGNKEAFEDIHEIFANSFLITAVLHIVGIVLHTFRNKDLIGLSMLDGKKASVSAQDVIPSAKPIWGLLFLTLTLLFGSYLYTNFNTETRELRIFGNSLELGENEISEEPSQE